MLDPQVTIVIKSFNELTRDELHACYKLRGEVFVVGQQICAVPDVDESDPLCHHVLLWLGDELAGTARLMPIDDGQSIKVGRVAVGQALRGRGLGKALMRAAQGWIDQVPGRAGLMSAQAYLEPWYASLGWKPKGERYQEAGIDHVRMTYGPF